LHGAGVGDDSKRPFVKCPNWRNTKKRKGGDMEEQKVVRKKDGLGDLVARYWATGSLVEARGILHAVGSMQNVKDEWWGMWEARFGFLAEAGRHDGRETSEELRQVARVIIVRNLIGVAVSSEQRARIVEFFAVRENCEGLLSRDLDVLGKLLDQHGDTLLKGGLVSAQTLNGFVVHTRYFCRDSKKMPLNVGILKGIYEDILKPKSAVLPALSWDGWEKLEEIHDVYGLNSALVRFFRGYSEEEWAAYRVDRINILEGCLASCDATAVVVFVHRMVQGLDCAYHQACQVAG